MGVARGCLVTGTDTGAGKTVLAAAIVAALAAAGEPVRAHKPVVTGVEDPPGRWPADHVLLGAMAGMAPEAVAPVRYGPPVSPHLGAALAGERLQAADILSAARAACAAADGPVIVEGVGGILVPLTGDYLIVDLAVDLSLPVVIAARPGLGTINHSLLTLQAARARGLDVRAVVLTPWPAHPSTIERSNRETLEHLGEVRVAVLGEVAEPSAELLAAAGARLPLEDLIGPAADTAIGASAGPASAVRPRR